MKTITVKSTPENEEKLKNFPSAGPRPSIIGMKNLYWGKNALCIKMGQYVYNVDRETYESFAQ